MGTFQSDLIQCKSSAMPRLRYSIYDVLSQGVSKLLQVIDLKLQLYLMKTDFLESFYIAFL